ncbi:MAG: 50S ribosomal protein L15 [Synergistaceae bacterium]|nr:50S ribosomal protein L15 [Synergistaceae bacterium]
MNLHDLHPVPGSKRKPKRLGQGIGSGTGKTAGKGHKGQKSRSGGGVRPGFEGGQMPLMRRIPKRGFNNARFAVNYQIVNIESLCRVFAPDQEVTIMELLSSRLVHNAMLPVKILARGEMDKPLIVKANAFSESAKSKIEAAGGKAEVV